MAEVHKGQNERAGRQPVRPSHPLVNLRDEIDRLFDDFVGGASPFAWPTRLLNGNRAGLADGSLVPACEVKESEKEYRFTFELPGMDEKSVDVSLDDDVLTVRAEKQEEKNDDNERYHLTERRYGAYERSIRLPEDADGDKIKADMKNGVLTLTAPKRPEAKKQAKKISVGSK